jgi:hypothetical protein
MEKCKEYNSENNEKINKLNENSIQENIIFQNTNNYLNSDMNINKNSLNKSYSNAKKYINFSSEKNTVLKNLDFYQMLDLDTDKKKKLNINNDIIYNEILNNLNDIINKLQIEDSRKQNYFISKNNLNSNLKYFLNDLTNFDEEKANKLLMDLEDIKTKYDYCINNINLTSQIDLEILDDLINNYNDYCIDFLNNIKNINKIREFTFLLKININKIFNNYFNHRNRQTNILLTNHKAKSFLNNKRNISTSSEINIDNIIDNEKGGKKKYDYNK